MLMHFIMHAIKKNIAWARSMGEVGQNIRFERMKYASDNVGMLSRLIFLAGMLAFIREIAIKALSSDGVALDIAILFLLVSVVLGLAFYTIPMLSFMLNQLVDLAEEAEDEEIVGLSRKQIRRRASYIISAIFVVHFAAFYVVVDHLMS
jgi:hypothetical protein